MHVIADLQLHSKYSRAVSSKMVLPEINQWAKRKGIGLVATGDWTHPLWMREIKANLLEMGNGLLQLKDTPERFSRDHDPLFLLATEVSCIYSQGGKGRRIHTLIWAPTIAIAEKINQELIKRGANLLSDGRPIVGLTSINIAELVFSVSSDCLIIPAHIWTPWYALFGSESGFDSIEECFGPFAKDIYAIETGLSSDPAMNWRIQELDSRAILSFSDAHSGAKLGREATVFDVQHLSYNNIRNAIVGHMHDRIAYTMEFYPEEGKYHYTGHRNCSVKHTPKETKEKGVLCPVCGRKLTVGVMHRVEELAGRSEESLQIVRKPIPGKTIVGTFSEAFPERPGYVMSVPLLEILSEALSAAVGTQTVETAYHALIEKFGSEFTVLLDVSIADIATVAGAHVAEGIEKVRRGDIVIDPGFDGVFGKVMIWNESNKGNSGTDPGKEQLSLW